MPLFNKAKSVKRAIRSVLSQGVSEIELVVVNDGSTDGSADVVRDIADGRIRLFHQENAGVSAARNRGIQESRSDWVAFIDADDEWLPDFLDTISRLRHRFPQARVLATRYLIVSGNGRRRPAIVRGLPSPFWEGVFTDYFAIASRSDPPVWSSAVVIHRAALNAVGLFPIGIHSGEDLLTWARLAARFPIGYSNHPLAVFEPPPTVFSRPGRAPQFPDLVGTALRELLDETPPEQRQSLRLYIAFWHKMRAVILLRMGDIDPARREIRLAREVGSVTWRIFLYRCLLSMPKSVIVRSRAYSNALRNFLLGFKNQ